MDLDLQLGHFIKLKVLRGKGHLSIVYIGDSFFTRGHTYSSCQDNINETVTLLLKLGFTIHLTKTILCPLQEIKFLGFIINTDGKVEIRGRWFCEESPNILMHFNFQRLF